MNTEEIKELLVNVERLKKGLFDAQENLKTVKAHNGQSGYSINVNGVSVAVSRMNNNTYMGTLVRGRDMIHLGAVKALSAIVDDYQYALKNAEKNLKDFVNGDKNA